MQYPRLVLAGTHSGAGKTTVSLALMSALRRAGMYVHPFKVGPDYIDPAFHARAVGNVSHNLDPWLQGEDALRCLFLRRAGECTKGGSSLSLIEGVMGLFDGAGNSAFASTAHVADILRAPVLLVIDAAGLSLSAAALVSGYAAFRPGPLPPHGKSVQAVLFNRVSGEAHYGLLRRCIEDNTGIPCLGYLPKEAAPPLPHRHLGLVPVQESKDLDAVLTSLADAASNCMDLEEICRLAGTAPECAVLSRMDGEYAESDVTSTAPASPRTADQCGPFSRRPQRPRIAVARDRAFTFYYPDNLQTLQTLGAELVFVSPLEDPTFPGDVHGLYIGGGFPESFAQTLETNSGFRRSLLLALEAGLPAYAECGGMLYLCDSLKCRQSPKEEEKIYAMTGFFHRRASMTERLQPFGYVTVSVERDCLLGPAGTRFRAHEFHYSRLEPSPGRPQPPETDADFLRIEKTNGRAWQGGLAKKNALALYPHLHFSGYPQIARSFVKACTAFVAERENG